MIYLTGACQTLTVVLLTMISGALTQFRLDYSSSSDARFCGNTCRNLAVIDRPLFLAFFKQQFYEVMSTLSDQTCNIDNRCYTLFTLTSDSYVCYISTVYSNGENEVSAYVISEAGPYNYQGAWLLNSPNCTFTDYAFANISSNLDLIYRCYSYGACLSEGGYQGVDNVHGLSTVYQRVDPYTFRQAQNVIRNNGLGDRQLFAYPCRLPDQCVREQPCRNGISTNVGVCCKDNRQ